MSSGSFTAPSNLHMIPVQQRKKKRHFGSFTGPSNLRRIHVQSSSWFSLCAGRNSPYKEKLGKSILYMCTVLSFNLSRLLVSAGGEHAGFSRPCAGTSKLERNPTAQLNRLLVPEYSSCWTLTQRHMKQQSNTGKKKNKIKTVKDTDRTINPMTTAKLK